MAGLLLLRLGERGPALRAAALLASMWEQQSDGVRAPDDATGARRRPG
eukprot:gene6855-56534_t